jgi:hypothetical protein
VVRGSHPNATLLDAVALRGLVADGEVTPAELAEARLPASKPRTRC